MAPKSGRAPRCHNWYNTNGGETMNLNFIIAKVKDYVNRGNVISKIYDIWPGRLYVKRIRNVNQK